jgi:glycosyltransferase involved in cell wall biosynthesis
MELSIIIPTRDRYQSLMRLLSSLSARVSPLDSVEVIVVENGASGDLRPRLASYQKKFSKLTHLYLSGQGVNYARNAGLERAVGEWILFLDDDCQIPNDWSIQSFRKLSKEFPDAKGFGGYYLTKFGAPSSATYYNSLCNFWLDVFIGTEGRALRLLGGNCFFRADIFKAETKFRQEISYGGSESELQSRLVAKGASFYLSKNLSVIHRPDFGWWGVLKRAWLQNSNRARFPAIGEAKVSMKLLVMSSQREVSFFSFCVLIPYLFVGRVAFWSTKIWLALWAVLPLGPRSIPVEERAG